MRILTSGLLALALLIGSLQSAAAGPVLLTTSNVSGTVTITGNPIPTLGLGSYTVATTYNAPTSLIPTTSFGFYDDYVFDVPTSFADSIASTISLNNLLGIDNLQVRLYQAPTNLGVLPILGNPAASPYFLPVYDFWSTAISASGFTTTVAVLPPTTLAAGRYVLEVRGTATGLAGGSYSGVLNVTPVPLPPSVSLMLSGLGLLTALGLIARGFGPPSAAQFC